MRALPPAVPVLFAALPWLIGDGLAYTAPLSEGAQSRAMGALLSAALMSLLGLALAAAAARNGREPRGAGALIGLAAAAPLFAAVLAAAPTHSTGALVYLLVPAACA